uniref:Uncharacterized protein n=1 Tax=Plectus sambesii TaxID=2011161 RepID=A0A914W268_9BILA
MVLLFVKSTTTTTTLASNVCPDDLPRLKRHFSMRDAKTDACCGCGGACYRRDSRRHMPHTIGPDWLRSARSGSSVCSLITGHNAICLRIWPDTSAETGRVVSAVTYDEHVACMNSPSA